jgi:hypothetical protein
LRWLVLLAFPAALLVPSRASAVDDKTTIEDLTPWTNRFGGQEAEWQYRVAAPKAIAGRAAWWLASDGRTLARGEAKVAVGAGQTGTVKLSVPLPPVKDGVVLKTRLHVSILVDDAAVASHEKTVWLFPRDPFTGRSEWLKSLKIVVFDPEKKTLKALELLKIPVEELGNVEGITELKSGILIVGEGLSFQDYPGLPEALTRAAARGVAVLCLAPSAGSFPIPGTENAKLPVPQGLSLRHSDVIAELDKRLDSKGWPGGKMILGTLVIRGEAGLVQGEVAGNGWPWFEATYTAPRGRLILCGFGIVSQLESTPTPRFLLARLLERLSEAPEQRERE